MEASHGHREGTTLSPPEVERQVSRAGAVLSTVRILTKETGMAHTCIKQALTPGHAGPHSVLGAGGGLGGQCYDLPSTAQDAEAQRGRGASPSQCWQNEGSLPSGQPVPEAARPRRAREGLGECQSPGEGRPWVVRPCQAQQGTDRALASGPSGPVQVRRKKCPHSFVCKLSCPGVRSKGWGVRVEGGGMCL